MSPRLYFQTLCFVGQGRGRLLFYSDLAWFFRNSRKYRPCISGKRPARGEMLCQAL